VQKTTNLGRKTIKLCYIT